MSCNDYLFVFVVPIGNLFKLQKYDNRPITSTRVSSLQRAKFIRECRSLWGLFGTILKPNDLLMWSIQWKVFPVLCIASTKGTALVFPAIHPYSVHLKGKRARIFRCCGRGTDRLSLEFRFRTTKTCG